MKYCTVSATLTAEFLLSGTPALPSSKVAGMPTWMSRLVAKGQSRKRFKLGQELLARRFVLVGGDCVSHVGPACPRVPEYRQNRRTSPRTNFRSGAFRTLDRAAFRFVRTHLSSFSVVLMMAKRSAKSSYIAFSRLSWCSTTGLCVLFDAMAVRSRGVSTSRDRMRRGKVRRWDRDRPCDLGRFPSGCPWSLQGRKKWGVSSPRGERRYVQRGCMGNVDMDQTDGVPHDSKCVQQVTRPDALQSIDLEGALDAFVTERMNGTIVHRSFQTTLDRTTYQGYFRSSSNDDGEFIVVVLGRSERIGHARILQQAQN
eukprot:scaffold2858_cov659-Pavlova_lutheri.AAC.54